MLWAKKLTSDGSFDSLLQVRSYRKIAPKFVPSTIASNETSKQVYSMVKDLKLSWALSFRALNKFFTPCPLVRSQTWPIKFLVPYCALYGRQLRISFSGSNSERTMSLPMTKSSGKNMYIAISNLAILNYWMQKYYRETLNHYVWCKSFLQPKQFVSGTLYCWESQALLVSIFMFAFNTEAMLG